MLDVRRWVAIFPALSHSGFPLATAAAPAYFPGMVHYFHRGYMVRTHPVHLPHKSCWQVQFTITCHDFPVPQNGKTFTFPDTYDSEMKANNRSMELADAIIAGELEGESVQTCDS